MVDRKNEIEIKIRKLLGQNFETKKFNRDGRPVHKRFELAIDGFDQDDLKAHYQNKEICSLFSNYFRYVSIVIVAWKGCPIGFVIPKSDFEDWWTEENLHKVIDRWTLNSPDLPHYFEECYGGEGTCKILVDLYDKCISYDKFFKTIETELIGICSKNKK